MGRVVASAGQLSRMVFPQPSTRVPRQTRAAFSQEGCSAGGAQTSVNTAVTSGRNTKGFLSASNTARPRLEQRPCRLYCTRFEKTSGGHCSFDFHNMCTSKYTYESVLCMCSGYMKPTLEMSEVTASSAEQCSFQELL